jgi:flagellar biosynthesis protein FliQ
MSQDYVSELVQRVLLVLAEVAGPFLFTAVLVGVLIGVVQATTQIQESTLSFVPKLAILGVGLAVGGPWFLERLVQFTTVLLREIAMLGPRGLS